MATRQIRIGEDCVTILEAWRFEQESLSEAIRRMDRCLKKHKEKGVKN
jgi:predicted CopG family antitoxin